jgi:precorrin-6A/cobalt-precorrin-6A reductase
MKGSEPLHLLILGGTAEARALAGDALARFGQRLRVTTSLAGRTRAPMEPAGALRRGGFGGPAGLGAYLQTARIDLVIDATHPFATRISGAAKEACDAEGIPLLALARPPWIAQPGDRWIDAADADAAAAALPDLGRRVFLTIGQGELGAFSSLDRIHFLVRLIDPPPAALPLHAYEIVLGRGPFTVEGERLIMARHAIDVLVAKASGGASTAAKLEAARALGIPVVMLRRPARESGESVERVADALDWIAHKLEELQEVSS